MNQFLATYGPEPRIWCNRCLKSTGMIASDGHELSVEDVRRYKRIHMCGLPKEPWDLPGNDASSTDRASSTSVAVGRRAPP